MIDEFVHISAGIYFYCLAPFEVYCIFLSSGRFCLCFYFFSELVTFVTNSLILSQLNLLVYTKKGFVT